MSESPPPPPLDDTQPLPGPPPQPLPAPPPGPAVATYGNAPLPVQPLLYSTPLRTSRPGVLTAVGVISIVVAGISMLASLSTGMQGLMFAVLMPKMTSMATRPPPPPTPVPSAAAGATTTTTTTASGAVALPRGAADQYQVIVEGEPSPANSSTAPAAAPAPPTTQNSAGETTSGTGTYTTISPITAPATAPASLSPSQIQSIIQRVQQMSGNGLNPSQVATLQTALQQNSPPLVDPAYAYSPILTVDKSPDGSVDVQFNGGGSLSLNPGGQVVSQSAVGTAIVPKLPTVALGVGVMLGIDALASIALAILLLIAGIQVFRNSPGAARLHRIFAVIKIPVGLVGAAAVAMLYGQMIGSMGAGAVRPGGAGAAMRTLEIGYFVFYALMSCAYPVALLIVLRTRTVRGYYQSVSS